MKMKLIVALMACLLLIVTWGCSQKAEPRTQVEGPKFYVFLAFGQSNMEGYPGIEAKDKTVDSRFQMLAAVDMPAMNRTKGNWYDAVPPLCRPSCGICPADYFGRTLVANLPSNIRVGVVNVSVAGCKIEMFDKDNFKAYASTQAAWMQNIVKEYDGNPYQKLVDMGKLAQKSGVIKGILLHQGESNSGDRQWATKVKGIYDNLTKDLNLKPEETPLLAGQLVNGGGASMMAELPKILPNSYIIASKGCQARTDNLHFAPAGYRELGKRYAETMLPLLGYKVAELKLPENLTPATAPANP